MAKDNIGKASGKEVVASALPPGNHVIMCTSSQEATELLKYVNRMCKKAYGYRNWSAITVIGYGPYLTEYGPNAQGPQWDNVCASSMQRCIENGWYDNQIFGSEGNRIQFETRLANNLEVVGEESWPPWP